MAGLLKGQILKHLSRFSKNLNPEKINISTLKGEGELSNLELDEVILMELLDLPTWMKLNKAVCNKVSIKIQWTKLKSQPICLYLDEVLLEIETCSEPRPPNNPSHESSYRSGGRYGFVDKVIDGIFVHINSVSVQFRSQKFHASLQLSRVKVQSLSPTWCIPTDLRQSRIRNEPSDEILLFKEVDWQTTRIEATACDEDMPTTPLRLIANQSKLRIVLKKRLSDCSIISSRIIFLLDDILWVLTDTQLKSAILYANSLKVMIKKSAEQSKKQAADKLHKQGQTGSPGSDHLLLQQQQQLQKPKSQTNEARHFQRFDVTTTSYHLITSRIDLHLCDDTPMNKESSPNHNRLIDGGAMQITLCKLSLDFYPFHLADMELIMSSGGERKNWYRYTDNQGSRNYWVQDLFKAFREEVSKARETCKVMSPSQSPLHKPGSRSHTYASFNTTKDHHTSKPRMTKLLESCIVLRIEEFIIYRVSTSDNKRSTPLKFFSSDKKALHLPSDMSVIHMEYTDYFFTEGIDYPVPHANLYVLVNPVRLTLDYLTMLWANYFSLSLAQMNVAEPTEMGSKAEHVDTKVEFLMPRIVMPIDEKSNSPESLQIQISKLTATNTRIENRFTLKDLQEMLKQYDNCDMFDTVEQPANENNLQPIPKVFMNIANGHMNPYLCPYALGLIRGQLPDGMGGDNIDAIKLLMKTNTLKQDASCDVWAVCADQVWIEFLCHQSSKARPVPFVESVPITFWICQPSFIPDGSVSLSTSSESFINDDRLRGGGSELEKRRKKKQLLQQYYSEESVDTDCQESDVNLVMNSTQEPNATNNSTDKNICDTDPDGNVQYTALELADFNIVAKIGGKLRAQLNHIQYISLLRLSDSITEFLSQLNADVDDLTNTSESSMSLSIPLVIPQFEFAMVFPYIAQLLPYSHPLDIYNSPTTNSSEGREGYGDTDIDFQEDLAGNQSIPTGLNDQILTVTQDDEGSTIMISEGLQVDNMQMKHSQSDSTIMCHITPSNSGLTDTAIATSIRKDSHSTEDVCQNVAQYSNLDTLGYHHLTGSDSGLSSVGSSLMGQRSRTGSKLTPGSVKKSFTVGMSNFVGKIKNKLDPDDYDDDNLSVRTDISDDDFEYLSMDENEAPAFSHANRSETASSTDTDDLSSVFAESTSASKAKETVSVIIFRLSGSELLIQKKDDDISLQLNARCVETEETGNVIYEDFYAKLSSTDGVIKHAPEFQQNTKYPLKFTFCKGTIAEKVVPGAKELGLMDVRAQDFIFKISNSSITHLSDFIEDETTGTPIPMHVSLSGVTFMLSDNVLQGSNSKPTTVNLANLFIYRYSDGAFNIQSTNSKKTGRKRAIDNNKLTHPSIEISTLTTNVTSSDESRLKSLENQNQQLRTLLDKLDNYSQEQETKLEELQLVQQKFDDLSNENQVLQEQLKSFAVIDDASIDRIDLNKVNHELESDNSKLAERVVNLEDELEIAKKEKESLLSTLELLQEDLMMSEQYRHRINNDS